MPQAPGLVPTQVPQGYAPDVHVDAPVDAFGGAVGHALEGLGSQIEQSSDKIWAQAVNLQNLQNETDAKNADAKYMMESGKLHADFVNKEGVNAGPEALAQHIQQLQDLRTGYRNDLNPAAARMYDASSLGFMGRNIFNAAGHSGQQMKVAANGAADSRISMAQQNMGQYSDDDVTQQRSMRQIESEVDAKGHNSGWSQEQIDATKQEAVSTGYAQRVMAIAKTNAPRAQRMLDEAVEKGMITENTANKLQATVQTQFRDQGSRFISDKVVLGDRRNGDEDNKPVQEYIDAGLDEAKKYNSKDPLFNDYVRSRIVTDYNRQKAIETDTDNMNTRVIGQALVKANAEGNLPTSLEELKAINPDVSKAWDEIGRNPEKQQRVLKQLEQNAKGVNIPTTPENMQQYHTYRGQAMAGTDEERAAFMAHDFGSEGKMTLTQRNGLMTMQDQMKHQAAISATSDPRTSRALSMLKPDLVAAGIDPRGGDDNRKDYYSFVGGLQDQLDQYSKDHPGKLPSREEIRTMGSQLMQEQVTSKGMFWDTKEPMYKLTVPEEEATRIKADPYWAKRNVTPNEGMIARIYRAEQFKEHYAGSGKKPAEAAFPPNAPELPVSK